MHGFGYAFAGEATDVRARRPEFESDGTTCWLRVENRDIHLYEGENVLGRDTAATVRLESMRISRYHARIVLSENQATLEDLERRTGRSFTVRGSPSRRACRMATRSALGRSCLLSTSAVRARLLRRR